MKKIISFSVFLAFISFLCSAGAAFNIEKDNLNNDNVSLNNNVAIPAASTIDINLTNFKYRGDNVYINVSMYEKNISAGTANWNNARTTVVNATQAIFNSHQNAIRQTGVIEYVEFSIVNISRISSYKINLWRPNGTNYDLIAQTPNLRPQIINGQNNVSVNLPAQEGDFLGESVIGTGSAAVYSTYAAPGGPSRYTYGCDPVVGGDNSTNFNWDDKNSTNTQHVILAKMRSPDAVFIGDSICAGRPGHYSYIEGTAISNLQSSYEYWFRSIVNTSYQNMGIGSQTTQSFIQRFNDDVVYLHPTYAILQGGVNDVAGGKTNDSILKNWETMLDTCENKGIKPVIVLILPWHNGAIAKRQQIDYINNQLILKAAAHNCTYIDCRDAIGFFNKSLGSWDVDPAYNADGIHFTTAGYEAIGKEMAAQWANITIADRHWNSTANNPTNIIAINEVPISTNIDEMMADVDITHKIIIKQVNMSNLSYTPGFVQIKH